MRQRELEILLERVPAHPNPSPHLEQYRTPPKIAADMLYRALAMGDIAERRVADLGCGTGMFAIGAMLLGAESANGFDVDASVVRVAQASAAALDVEVAFEATDVNAVGGDFDTVVMNPPFGAQFAARHLDTAFVEKAALLAPVIYSLHLSETGRHLERLALEQGLGMRQLTQYTFPLPAQFKFHTRESLPVSVALYRFERAGAS